MAAHLDLFDVTHKVQLGVVLDHRAAGAQLFDFLFWVRRWRSFLFDGHSAGNGGEWEVDHVGVTVGIEEGGWGAGCGSGVIVFVFLPTSLRGAGWLSFICFASGRAKLVWCGGDIAGEGSRSFLGTGFGWWLILGWSACLLFLRFLWRRKLNFLRKINPSSGYPFCRRHEH